MTDTENTTTRRGRPRLTAQQKKITGTPTNVVTMRKSEISIENFKASRETISKG